MSSYECLGLECVAVMDAVASCHLESDCRFHPSSAFHQFAILPAATNNNNRQNSVVVMKPDINICHNTCIYVTFWNASVFYFGMLDGMCFTIRSDHCYISDGLR